jgi:hypothetical protein
MPFAQIMPRPFSASSVEAYVPSASGVYGISNAHEWILIGESDDIRADLLSHLRESGTALLKRQPTGFVFEVCNAPERSSRKDRLVQEYAPACNRHRSRYSNLA